MQHQRQFMFAKDVPGALAMNKPPRGGLFGESKSPGGKTNYTAQIMERFLYRGMMMYPRGEPDINERILREEMRPYSLDFIREASVLGSADISGKVKYPTFSYFEGPMINTICFIVRHFLYKGKDPIKNEPVVLGRTMQEYHTFLSLLPEDKYSRNVMTGSDIIDSFSAYKRNKLINNIRIRGEVSTTQDIHKEVAAWIRKAVYDSFK